MATAAAGPLVIYLGQPEGRKLLSDIRNGQNGCYQPILHRIFSQQVTRAGCGVQSCALVLSANAIGCQMRSGQCKHDQSPPMWSPPAKRQRTDDIVEAYASSKNYKLDQLNSQVPEVVKSYFVQAAAKGAPALSESGLPYTEVGLYNMPETMVVTWRELVAKNGLTLAEVAAILRSHGCTVWLVHSTESSVDQFRRDVRGALSSPDSCSGVIVNFHRDPLSSTEKSHKSHHSPLVAYHTATDAVLVLDTAAPVEHHFWTSVEAMFTAMLTQDRMSGKSRGYCFFTKSYT